MLSCNFFKFTVEIGILSPEFATSQPVVFLLSHAWIKQLKEKKDNLNLFDW